MPELRAGQVDSDQHFLDISPPFSPVGAHIAPPALTSWEFIHRFDAGTEIKREFRLLPLAKYAFVIAVQAEAPSGPPTVTGAHTTWRLAGTIEHSANRYAWIFETNVLDVPPEDFTTLTIEFDQPTRHIAAQLWALSTAFFQRNVVEIVPGFIETWAVSSATAPSLFPWSVKTYQGSGDTAPQAPSRGNVFALGILFPPADMNLSAAPFGTRTPGFNINHGDSFLPFALYPEQGLDPVTPFTSIQDLDILATTMGSIAVVRDTAHLAMYPVGWIQPMFRVGDAEAPDAYWHPTVYVHDDVLGNWPESDLYGTPVDWGLFTYGGPPTTPKVRLKQRDDEQGRIRGRAGNNPTSKQRSNRGGHGNTYL